MIEVVYWGRVIVDGMFYKALELIVSDNMSNPLLSLMPVMHNGALYVGIQDLG